MFLLLSNYSCIRPKPADLFAEVADFDGVLYTIAQKDGSNIISVSISLSFYKEIEKFGDSKVNCNLTKIYISQVLSREYGEYLKPRAASGTNVTLEFDCDKLPDDIEGLATKAALLRRNCFASVFEHFFDYQNANASNPSAKVLQGIINFRSDETM